VALATHQEIDRHNIYQSSILAMLRAVEKLQGTPDYILVDGMKLPGTSIPHEKIIQGDAKSQSIAAASIIAKVTRDNLMQEYHQQWPQYGFDSHKGYATPQHLEALKQHGPCPIHRLSFEPIKSTYSKSLSLEFDFMHHEQC
jgi:ribonuclease HII